MRLRDVVGDVHARATVIGSAGTWIAMSNIGTDAIKLVFVFSL